ncbi:extracellular solute-binding protein [Nocardia terpenica]|uniref:extracellular solute-binding protein n=1 Tax=Nocardia terpenica TaxID=455432 RepID=UPI002FDF53A0
MKLFHTKLLSRGLVGICVVAAAATVLTACGSESDPPTITWYAFPDNGGAAERAHRCADASGGAYRVRIEVLPADATMQREQLVRRLAARDSSIDVFSLDVAYVAEFANAGFLRPFSDADAMELTAGMLPAPVATGRWNNTLYAAPFKTNIQVLWFKKSMAAAAGVDPRSPDFTWDKVIEAAVSQGKKIGVQGARYEGYMQWVTALISSAGGRIVSDPEAGRHAAPSMAGPAGAKAADIVGGLARSGAAPADLSVAREEQARANFQSDQGMFMVNWPYVLAAGRTAVEQGTLARSVLDDYGFARYPRVFADKPSTPPLGGTDLAVGAYGRHPDRAVSLIECVNAPDKATQYMLDEGEPSPYAASYDDPKVRASYPDADLIRQSVTEAGSRPITPYYPDIAGSVINTWHPPASVRAGTPAATDAFMSDVLSGKRLL